jgi:membrane fusion protein (multidrug efflux system)
MTAETAPRPLLARLRRTLLRLVLLIVVPLIAIVAASHFYFAGGRFIVSENAYVKADIISISADTAGRVIAVAVDDNTQVTSGSELFRLDPEPVKLQVAEASAEMAVARSEIESMRAEYREANVAIEAARERVRFLASQYERQSALKAKGLGVTESHDEALHNLQAAERSVSVLAQRARRALANLGGSANLPIESHPSFQQAQARHQQALTLLEKTIVLSPGNGIVSNVQLQAGEYVQAGVPVFSLINTDEVWVEANLKETRLTNIRTGQSATVEVDAYPDIEWPARVSTIAPATGAEFSLLPAQNATGNWVKVVQRIPVALAIEKTADDLPLRAGMTATVSIDTRRKRRLPGWLSGIAHAQDVPPVVRKVLHVAFAIDASPDDITASSDSLNVFSAALQPIEQTMPSSLSALAASLAQHSNQSSPQSSASTLQNNTPITLAAASTLIDNSGEHGDNWLLRQNDDHYTVQIGSSADLQFLKRFSRNLPQDRVIITYHYKTNADARAEYGLASGIYGSQAEAQAALRSLPKNSKRYGPWVRRIGTIQREIKARGALLR